MDWYVMRDDGSIVALGAGSLREPVRFTLASGAHATLVPCDALRGSRALILVEHDADPVDEAARRFNLSPREREIAGLVVAGLARAAIAQRLAIVEATVDHHLRSLYAKTGARGRAACVARLTGRDASFA